MLQVSREFPTRFNMDTEEQEETYVYDNSHSYSEATEAPNFSFYQRGDCFEYLNEKYKLNIDFSQDLSEEDAEKIREAYVAESLFESTRAIKKEMLNYFDTLGDIDEIYDSAKNFLGSNQTREKIEEYYDIQESKNQILTDIIKNKGTLSFENSLKIPKILKYNMQNMSFDEIQKYAIDCLNINPDDIKAFKEKYPNVYDLEGNVQKDALNRLGEDNIKNQYIDFILNNNNVKNKGSMSFEEAYKVCKTNLLRFCV